MSLLRQIDEPTQATELQHHVDVVETLHADITGGSLFVTSVSQFDVASALLEKAMSSLDHIQTCLRLACSFSNA